MCYLLGENNIKQTELSGKIRLCFMYVMCFIIQIALFPLGDHPVNS